ncbi:MAG: hypothetical protein ACT4OJ_03665 [Bacteroidota bacterium]
MNINRHNYEEYFILYMDNELGSEERRMVEAFVQQQPDLKEELDNLLQYKLVPDTSIIFEGKEELLKENSHSFITPGNYEEWLSLYIDNELTAEQKQLVDVFIVANPPVKNELELLQKTKLQPEPIVFTHKESLYRKEEKVRRIFPLQWRAAAAILILALGLSSIFIFNKKQRGGKDEVATTNPAEQKPPGKNDAPVIPEKNNNISLTPEKKDAIAISPGTAIDNKKATSVLPGKENNRAVADNRKLVVPNNKLPENNSAVTRKEEPVIAENKPSNNLPLPLNNPNAVNNNKPEEAVAYNKPEESNPVSAAMNADVTNKTAQPSNIVQASYNGNNDDAIFDQPDGRKNKNRGIFRKIARTFEKRTNIDPTDDNKLLVAGLAIKLK